MHADGVSFAADVQLTMLIIQMVMSIKTKKKINMKKLLSLC
jgi:hypothetical protein